MNTDLLKPKILIVDSSLEITQVMSNLLEAEYELAITETGEAGLMLVKTFQPDLVLIDIFLPDMSGYEVCEKIKNNPATKDM